MPRTAISPATNNSFASIIQDKNQIENQLDSEFVGYNINASKIEPEFFNSNLIRGNGGRNHI